MNSEFGSVRFKWENWWRLKPLSKLKTIAMVWRIFPGIVFSFLKFDFLKKKRGLLLFDIRFFNCTIGDFVELYGHLWAARLNKKSPVDIAIYVPTEPPFAPHFESTNEKKLKPSNAPVYLNEVLLLSDLWAVDQFHVFYDERKFDQFVSRDYFRRVFYPSIWRIRLREYHDLFEPFEWGTNELWAKETGQSLGLGKKIRPIYKEWMNAFRSDFAKDGILVTFAPRIGLSYYTDRNTPQEDVNFVLRNLLSNPRVRVAVVGTPQKDLEAVKAFEGVDRSRVFVTKANGFTVFQDFVCVALSDGFVGMSTGAIAAARSSDTPFAYLKVHIGEKKTNGDYWERTMQETSPNRPYQRYIYKPTVRDPEFVNALENLKDYMEKNLESIRWANL